MELSVYFASAQERREAEKPKAAGLMVERANEVSIHHVLLDFFDSYVPSEGLSFKTHCPFEAEHPDGGVERGFRTYPDTNSSYCFIMHGFLPPVRLVQKKYRLPPYAAARKILGYYGLLKPREYHERWHDVEVWVEQNGPKVGDLQYAVEALHMALRNVPGYKTRQYDSDVLSAWEKVLEESASIYSVPDLSAWYDKSREALISLVRKD